MNNISGFLQKFLSLDKNNKLKIEAILNVIKEKTKIELKKEDLDIKEENLKLNCNPVLRNEIFMYKEKIESELKKQKIFLKIL